MKKLLMVLIAMAMVSSVLAAGVSAKPLTTRSMGADYITMSSVDWNKGGRTGMLKTSTKKGHIQIQIPRSKPSAVAKGSSAAVMEIQVFSREFPRDKHVGTFYHYPLLGTTTRTYYIGHYGGPGSKQAKFYAKYKSNYRDSVRVNWRD